MSKPVIDLTSPQPLLTNKYIYTTAIKPEKTITSIGPSQYCLKKGHCNNPLATHTPKKPSPIWGNLPKVLTKPLAKLPMAT